MKFSFNNLFCVLLVFIFSSLLIAQKPNYKFKSIDQPEGLINSTIQVIFEDSFGFIWLGTHQGVQRYDGINFKNYEYSERDSTGLSSNFISGFCEDADKNIWIVTSAGLNKYVRSTDKVIRFNWNNDQLNKSKNQLLSDVFQDQSDHNIIWITSPENGLIKLNTANDSIVIYSIGDISYLPSSHSLTLPFPGEKNKLLLGTSKLISFDKITGRFEVLLSLDENSEIPNNLINDAVIDPTDKNLIWIATGDIWGRGTLGGLIRYNLRTGAKKIFSPETYPSDMSDKHLLSLCFYDDNKLWIGTRYNGALLYILNEDQFYNYKKNNSDPESFNTPNSVRSILKDKSGTLWFGTWGDGIVLLTPTSQKFSHYKYLPEEKNGLLDNYINTFTEDKEGDIWIGTKSGSLSKFNPGEKTFENYFPEFISNSDKPTEITYLFYDSRENLWIGTYSDGLYRYNIKTKEKIHYRKGTSKNEVTQARISAISELNVGEILISTYGGGLNIYSYETNSIRHFLNDPNNPTSIPDNQIWLPFLGNDGKYYFSGNSTHSLIKFDPKTEKFYDLDPLKRLSTFTMPYKDYGGKIYLNDVSEGLRELKFGKEFAVNTLYDNNGNSIKNIESILGDSQNKLWLGTGNGLIEYDTRTKIVKRYDVDDGLQGYQFNRFAAFKSSNGEMYFGGNNGFSTFKPDEIKLSSYQPPIEFIDFKLFQESVNIDESSVLPSNILMLDKVELNYDQNDFTISFATLDYSNPGKIHYKYILENHDKDWIDAGHKNYASYTNMDPGDYNLKVLATNGDGVWVKEPKQLTITINPPIWQTTAAYILYIILFAAGIFLVDRYQRSRLLTKERITNQIKESNLRAKLAEAENERKSTELEEARQLQLSMLPKQLPQLPHLDIAVYMKTATEVGGDYYDFNAGLDGTLTAAIGDATGHGMKAGTIVSMVKALFSSGGSRMDMKTFFDQSSDALKEIELGRLMMAFMMIKIKSNKIEIANAGMPPLFIYRKQSKAVEEIMINGMPLGAMKNFPYEIKETEIATGDTILLLSDGLPELKNGNNEQYSYLKVKEEFRSSAEESPSEIVGYLKNSASRWSNGVEPDDDVTFVVIKVK